MSRSIRVTVDIVAFAVEQGALEVLLIKRKYEPFRSSWALPGGFVTDEDANLDQAAHRELVEETNVRDVFLEQLYTFGARERDPRGRTVTVSYMALLRADSLDLRADTDASGVAWWPTAELPDLAFDHREIVDYALTRLKYKIEYTPAAFSLLPEKFTLRELQVVYEAVLGKPVDNRNFRKKFLASGILEELDELSQEGSYRPARLYRLIAERFEELKDRPQFVF